MSVVSFQILFGGVVVDVVLQADPLGVVVLAQHGGYRGGQLGARDGGVVGEAGLGVGLNMS